MTESTVEAILPIRSFLKQYQGKAVFHPPLVDDKGILVGNNGDRLMVLGTEIIYRDLDIHRTNNPEEADLLVLGASGGMLDKFTHIPRIFRWLSQTYPAKPMCVLPSTFYYPNRPFAEDVGFRTAPLTIFCREAYSYRHLTEQHNLPETCSVVLDRDLAFELERSPYVASVRAMAPQHTLFVERVDVEHVAVALQSGSTSMKTRKLIGRILPDDLKKSLYPLIRFIRSKRQTPFRNSCEHLLQEYYPNFKNLPRFVADISNVNTCTFDEFTKAVGQAAVIFTTRLHVAILGAMAGKPTFVFEGSYHKIRGIYEYSLSKRPDVRFVPISAQRQP